MVSVVRLLPRHKIARNGVPYTKLLAWVLNARFFNLIKFLTFVSVPFCLLQRFDLGIAFLYSFSGLMAAIMVVLLARKVRIATYSQYYPSLAWEIGRKLLAPSYLSLAAAYSLSAVIYIWLFASGSSPLFEVIKVELPPTPPGLPKNLNASPHGDLRVVNQEFCFRHHFAIYVGFVYAAYHLIAGFDVLGSEVRIEAPWRQLKSSAQKTLVSGFVASSAIVGSWILVYSASHNYVHKLYKVFGLNIQGQTEFPSIKVISGASYHFFGLVMIWTIANSAFRVYMSLGPYHRGHTISSPSQDPNGSLLSGFQHRSGSLTQLTAWQELLFIARRDEQRRKSIFKDVDSDRVVWKLIRAEYAKLVGTTVQSLEAKPKPAEKVPQGTSKASDALAHAAHMSSSCLFTRPATTTTVEQLKPETKNVFVRARISPSMRLIDQMQDPSAQRSQDAIRWLGVAIPDLKKPLLACMSQTHRKFLLSSVGKPFRHTSQRQAHKLIPQCGLLSLALESVSGLIVASHDEDPFGYVQVDIAATLAQLDTLLSLLDKVMKRDKSQWEDVAVQAGLVEPDFGPLLTVHQSAVSAFDSIATRFGIYFDDLKVNDAVKKRAGL
ncbi:Nuclear envelope protein ndc1 [Wickerhamiella sorbophila]|uniref:Nuclear envelope protein ndc1 n=1 Tax=Wickerhamiella sorbophila TaxID=45607 RepID=A0A2T0FLF1_9ASCO|nr:Nuclear envelope protein ndc1 [Wickerhamiella sorbophila]PRT55805.1 Nuclear envelope protein ndc1 [Wickerhamiella sorbophila]